MIFYKKLKNRNFQDILYKIKTKRSKGPSMNYKTLILLFVSFFCREPLDAKFIHHAFELPVDSTLYSNIKEQYLKSFKIESSLKTDISKVLLDEQQKMHHLSLIFDLFSRNERQHKHTPISLVTPLDSLDNLNIFCGSKSKPKHTLLAQVARNTTNMGLAYFSRLLAQPIDDVKALTHRQELIYELLDDHALLAQLKMLLNELAAVEPHIVALWQSPEQAGKSVKDADFYYQSEYYRKWSSFAGNAIESLNENKRALNLKAHSAKIAFALCIISIAGQAGNWFADKDKNRNGFLFKNETEAQLSIVTRTIHFFQYAYRFIWPFIAALSSDFLNSSS